MLASPPVGVLCFQMNVLYVSLYAPFITILRSPIGGGGSKNPVQTFWNFNVPVTCSRGLLTLLVGRQEGHPACKN